MLIVELGIDDFDESGAFVKIGKVAGAIERANGSSNLLDAERKIYPRINAAVQLGELHPLEDNSLAPMTADYGSGKVSFNELVEWGRTAHFYFVRAVEHFTVKGANGESTMNRAAYDEYLQAKNSRLSVGRYTLEEAAQYVADNSNANAKSIFNKLREAALVGDLAIYWPGSDEVYKPKPHDPVKMNFTGVRGPEEAYWNDLNGWLEKNELRLVLKFPAPSKAGDNAQHDLQYKSDYALARIPPLDSEIIRLKRRLIEGVLTPDGYIETEKKIFALEAEREDWHRQIVTPAGAHGVVEQVNYSSKAEQQEDEILRIIEEVLLLKPLHLPQVKKGKAGTKAAVRRQLGIPSSLFLSDKVFNTAWERLRANNKIKESE